jgi:hypothetical protein
MAIEGFTGTLAFPMVRGVLPRGPDWRPAPGFTGLKQFPNIPSTISRPIYQPTEYGRGVIVETVKKHTDAADVPVRRRVRCMREIDGRVVRETWSDPITGVYRFEQLVTTDRYSVIAYDHEHDKRAAIADNLEAKP